MHQIFSLLIYPKQKLSNQITETKIIFKPLIKNNKKITLSGLMVVGDQYYEGDGPVDSAFPLLQMLYQS